MRPVSAGGVRSGSAGSHRTGDRAFVAPARVEPALPRGLLDRVASDARLRLRLLGWTVVVIWAGGAVLNVGYMGLALGLGSRIDAGPVSAETLFWGYNAFCAVGALSGALLLRALRGAAPDRVPALAVRFGVGTAWLLSLAEALTPLPVQVIPGVPVVAGWVLFYAVVVPAPAAMAFRSALVGAVSAPLFFGLAAALGPGGVEVGTALLWSSSALGLGAASILPLRVLQRWELEARQARAEARRLGSYELVERLGEGGMGQVWRARHDMLVRPAAIKLIRPERLAGDAVDARLARARFEREAQIVAGLTSPHTVTVYDFGSAEDGTLFLVMELLPGMHLGTLVAAYGPVSPERVVHLLDQAAASLEEAHAAGLVHRDIKPENLWLGPRGTEPDFLTVLDFGLARAETTRRDATGEGGVAGTPGYMAPETVAGERVEAAADLYALGCVAWYLLTGRRVFERAGWMAEAAAHLREEPDPAPLEAAGVPGPLIALVLALLAKDPDDRPRTVGHLRLRLDAVRSALPDTWTEASARSWWAGRLGRPARLVGGDDETQDDDGRT